MTPTKFFDNNVSLKKKKKEEGREEIYRLLEKEQ